MHARMNPDAEYLLRPHGRMKAPDILTFARGMHGTYVQSLFTKYRIYPLPPKEPPA